MKKNLCPDLICVIENKTSTISNANVRENVHRDSVIYHRVIRDDHSQFWVDCDFKISMQSDFITIN